MFSNAYIYDLTLLEKALATNQSHAFLSISKSRAASINPDWDQSSIELWAHTCWQANKALYLKIPASNAMPRQQKPFQWTTKLMLDRLAAAILLVLFGPLMLVVSGLIRLQDGGPVFFNQWRVGENGKLFRIHKFRSMVVDAEKRHHEVMGTQAGLHKLQGDPRVTPLGKWLRKLSLDELPQLLNVLRGEMSLVGPRPWAIYDAVRIPPELQERLNALPGITGAWQVEARSHDCDLKTVNQMDLDYLETWTFQSDLRFLLLTVPKVVTGFGAY